MRLFARIRELHAGRETAMHNRQVTCREMMVEV
jgi:hypothetical protein